MDSVVKQYVITVVGMLTGGNSDVRPEDAEVGTKKNVGFGKGEDEAKECGSVIPIAQGLVASDACRQVRGFAERY